MKLLMIVRLIDLLVYQIVWGKLWRLLFERPMFIFFKFLAWQFFAVYPFMFVYMYTSHLFRYCLWNRSQIVSFRLWSRFDCSISFIILCATIIFFLHNLMLICRQEICATIVSNLLCEGNDLDSSHAISIICPDYGGVNKHRFVIVQHLV